MATSGTVEKSIEDLEKEVTCAICRNTYNEPKALPCCHYYCKECVRALAQRKGLEKPFSCPECRVETTLPQGSVDELPTAFFVNRIKEVLSRLARAHGKVEATCEMCSVESKAEAFCKHCFMFICGECVKQHHRMKVFFGHEIASFAQLKDNRDIVVPKPSLKSCESHDQPMNIYCFDCSSLICRDCTIKMHNGHNHEFVKMAAPEMKKALRKRLQPLKKAKSGMMNAVEDINNTKQSVEIQSHYVSTIVESMHSRIFEDQKHLLEATVTQTAQKLENLTSQEKKLLMSCAVIDSVVDYTERCIEHLADDELMATHTNVQGQIDREIEKHCNGKDGLTPVEEPSIEIVRPAGRNFISVKVVLAGLVRPLGVAVTSEDIIYVEKQRLVLLDKNARKLKCIPASSYGVDLLRGVACDGDYIYVTSPQTLLQLSLDTKVVRRLDVEGACFSSIAVMKDEIVVCDANSVCKLYTKNLDFVKDLIRSRKDGEKLGGKKRVSGGEKYVSRISGGEKRVSSGEKHVLRVSGSEKCDEPVSVKLASYLAGYEATVEPVYKPAPVKPASVIAVKRVSKKKPTSIHSLSSDQDGNLYLTDSNSSCVFVYNSRGSFMQIIGDNCAGESKLFRPSGICVTDKHVFVANLSSHNISIFKISGEFVISCGRKGGFTPGQFEEPQGICTDGKGGVYICDKERIQFVTMAR